MTWLIVTGIFLLLLVGILLLRVRLRLILEPEFRQAGITIGRRTGFEADLMTFRGAVRVAGIPVYQMDLRKGEAEQPKEGEVELPKPATPRRRFRLQKEKINALRGLLPEIKKASFNYIKGLYRATRIEELGARIEAGFDSPDQTGCAFGYYQAALFAAPAVVSRIQFIPVWIGPAFTASGRLVLAVPLYQLLWRTVVLLWQFPTRKLIKLARERKKGDHDV